MQRHEGGYYIRLLARDRPGAAAAIATRTGRTGDFARNRSCSAIRTAAASAADAKPAAPVPVILITYATTEDAVRARACRRSRRDGVIAGEPQMIRIEKN